MLKFLSSKEAEAFAREIALLILTDLSKSSAKSGKGFSAAAEKAMRKAAHQIERFASKQRLNWYQRSKAANAFLWALKEGGCSKDYADRLTEWFVHQL